MRLIRAGFSVRRRYLVGAMLALVVIAAILITTLRLLSVSSILPNIPKAIGLPKGVSTGGLTRVDSIIPAKLPTSSTFSFTLPYSSSSLATHARQAAKYAATNPQAPRVTPGNGALAVTSLDTHAPGLVQSFDGINAVKDLHVNGYDNDPPDQGLCVNSSFVVEQVNLAMAVYHHNGSMAVGPFSLTTFFAEDPREFIADPRCYFDPTSGLWVSTVVAFDQNIQNSHLDLAVNPGLDPTAAWTIYRIDTTDASLPACPCWPDNDRLAADRYGVYITQNEFNGAALQRGPVIFKGSQIYAISKLQLKALRPAPYYVHYGDLTIGGMPADALYPVFTQTSAPAEFFMSSIYRGLSNDNQLGIWALTDQAQLDSGGIPQLSSTLISSEVYGRPPLAIQKGSSAPIDPDDARMQDVTYYDGVIWVTLNIMVNVDGESVNRAGVAWFAVRPTIEHGQLTQARIEDQGYIATKGEYLLYGALTVNQAGKGLIIMALVGPNYYPSVVYTTFSANGTQKNFSPLHLVVSGNGPANIGACRPAYGGICTWGDYSAAAVDGLRNIWLASEYIPGGAVTRYENWGTRIIEIMPGA